jgi:glycosyltransferase involved in cell wall biosynthesis
MLPRLLYVGDVPVEASYHGSALLYRLLSDYPADRLTIVETATPSEPNRRLLNVSYFSLPIANPRWLNTRFHRYAVVCYTEIADQVGPRLAETVVESGFGEVFESVLTVAHGFGWQAAASIARKRKLPLHLIVHDDWPRAADVAFGWRKWLDACFRRVYGQAQSRMCVSPSMSRSYEERYGAPAQVIYPSRAVDCPDDDEPPARLARNDKPFTIAFAGTINSDGYIQALRALQESLKTVDGRLLIFGPVTPDVNGANTEICGLVSSSELLTRLREQCHALFVPMSFNPSDRGNMEMAFPSKLADYTATGLPLLIYGPAYSSVVTWAHENPGASEIVESEPALGAAVQRLANDPDHRVALGKRALEVGRQYFSHTGAKELFYQSLSVQTSV